MNGLFGELLPSWLDAELWAAFIDGRKKMGKRYAPTEYAKKLILMELDKLRKQGHPPNEVLAKAVRSGYLDVYPIGKREFTPTIVSGSQPLAPVSERKPETDEQRRKRLEIAGFKR